MATRSGPKPSASGAMYERERDSRKCMLSGPPGLARPLRGCACRIFRESLGLAERTEHPQLRRLTSRALVGQPTTSLTQTVSGRWCSRVPPLFGNSGIDINRPQSRHSATTGGPSIFPAIGWTWQKANAPDLTGKVSNVPHVAKLGMLPLARQCVASGLRDREFFGSQRGWRRGRGFWRFHRHVDVPCGKCA